MSKTTETLIKIIVNIFEQFEYHISLIEEDYAINTLVYDLSRFDELFGGFELVKLTYENTKEHYKHADLIKDVLEAEAIFNALIK